VTIDAMKVKENGLGDEVSCFGCKQSWSLIRLVSLAMSNPSRKFFLDVEAISMWLGLKPRQVYSIVKENGVEKRGNLYNFGEVLKAR
jgi:hypothetical protein